MVAICIQSQTLDLQMKELTQRIRAKELPLNWCTITHVINNTETKGPI